MTSFPPILNPPERLLCGPGPSNVSPAVLEAMQRPLLGHLDPDLHDILTELVATLRATWRAERVLLLQPGFVVVLVARVVHEVQLIHQAASLEHFQRTVDRDAV